VPTLNATAESVSEAPRRRRSRASTSPCRRGKSFVPALSLRPSPARTRKAIKSSARILATSPSSGTAKPPPPPARRVRRSMSVLRLARLRLWRSCSTARLRPSTSVGSKPDKKLLHLYATLANAGLYVFACKNLTNISAGIGARSWAISANAMTALGRVSRAPSEYDGAQLYER
jgi:hypothetical protein